MTLGLQWKFDSFARVGSPVMGPPFGHGFAALSGSKTLRSNVGIGQLDPVVDDNSNWVEFTDASTSGPRLANIPLGRPLGESMKTRIFGRTSFSECDSP